MDTQINLRLDNNRLARIKFIASILGVNQNYVIKQMIDVAAPHLMKMCEDLETSKMTPDVLKEYEERLRQLQIKALNKEPAIVAVQESLKEPANEN